MLYMLPWLQSLLLQSQVQESEKSHEDLLQLDMPFMVDWAILSINFFVGVINLMYYIDCLIHLLIQIDNFAFNAYTT